MHFCLAEFGEVLADLSSQSLKFGLSHDEQCRLNLRWTELHSLIELPDAGSQERLNSLQYLLLLRVIADQIEQFFSLLREAISQAKEGGAEVVIASQQITSLGGFRFYNVSVHFGCLRQDLIRVLDPCEALPHVAQIDIHRPYRGNR